MSDSESAERRRSTRIPCRVSVILRKSDGRDLDAVCIDVNSSGIAIETENHLAVGQRLKLLLRKGSGETKPVPLLVMYRMEKHYGLSALEGPEDLLDLIPLQG